MTRSDKEKYTAGAVGSLITFVLAALLPARFNPAIYIQKLFV